MADHNGGYRAGPATSNCHVVRLAFQNASALIADSGWSVAASIRRAAARRTPRWALRSDGSRLAVAVWLPGVRTVAEVGVGEAVAVLQAHAEQPVQADVGESDQGQGHD